METPTCSICGTTACFADLRGNVCRNCRQRAVNTEARTILFLVQGKMSYRQLKRAALALAATVQQLDGDVPAAIRAEEERDRRRLTRRSA